MLIKLGETWVDPLAVQGIQGMPPMKYAITKDGEPVTWKEIEDEKGGTQMLIGGQTVRIPDIEPEEAARRVNACREAAPRHVYTVNAPIITEGGP